MKTGGVISVQVLSEFAHTASRKAGMAWSEVAGESVFVGQRAPDQPALEAILRGPA